MPSSRGVSQYVASESHRIIYGRLSNPSKDRGVLFLQGSHSLADNIDWDPVIGPTVRFIVRHGYRFISGDLSQTTTQGTFGNDTVQTRAEQLRAFLGAPGKVHILCGSGGGAAALNYALQNPDKVASICATAPLVDTQDFHDHHTDSQVTAAEVEAAFGGAAAYAAAMPTHNPTAIADKSPLKGVPLKFYYSTNDPYIDPNTVFAYQGKILAIGGSCEIVSMGDVGHSANGINPQDVLNFFGRNN